jgi:hypothetical protein
MVDLHENIANNIIDISIVSSNGYESEREDNLLITSNL